MAKSKGNMEIRVDGDQMILEGFSVECHRCGNATGIKIVVFSEIANDPQLVYGVCPVCIQVKRGKHGEKQKNQS